MHFYIDMYCRNIISYTQVFTKKLNFVTLSSETIQINSNSNY